MNQCVKEYIAVAVGKQKRLMSGNRSVRRLGQRCQAKVSQASTFQRGSSFHQLFGLGIYTKTET
jgi:hypothetical protein